MKLSPRSLFGLAILCGLSFFCAHAKAQGSSTPAKTKETATMHAKGTFDVKVTPQADAT
jgi:hypothetical protein